MSLVRKERISEEIKKEVSDIMRTELKDPRLTSMTSITNVELTKDLRYAKLYVSVLGNADVQKSTLQGLNNATGYIRKELGKRVKIHFTPELYFYLDESLEYSIHITKIINEISHKENNEELKDDIEGHKDV
jgi:ribosome-binding factor A